MITTEQNCKNRHNRYQTLVSSHKIGVDVLYRVSQEERSIFWEVIVSVILSKKLYMNMCPIPNGVRDRAILLYCSLASLLPCCLTV